MKAVWLTLALGLGLMSAVQAVAVSYQPGTLLEALRPTVEKPLMPSLQRSLSEAASTGDRQIEAAVLYGLGLTYAKTGNSEAAALYLRASLLRAVGDAAFEFTVASRLQSAAAPKSSGLAQAWITYYYLHPDPEPLPSVLRLLASEDVYADPDALPPLVAFLAELFRRYPERVVRWQEELYSEPATLQLVLQEATWYARVSAKTIILPGGGSLSPPQGTAPEMLNMPITSASIIDMLWASFMASGDARYVRRILSVLDWQAEPVGNARSLAKFALVEAAIWSLTSNAHQHPRVYAICAEAMATASPTARAKLAEILGRNPEVEVAPKRT